MDYKDKVKILADLWGGYRFDDNFVDFFEYNDLGMPLAVLIHEEIVATTPRAAIYVEESYELLLGALSIEDKDYDSLDAMFFEAGKTN